MRHDRQRNVGTLFGLIVDYYGPTALSESGNLKVAHSERLRKLRTIAVELFVNLVRGRFGDGPNRDSIE